MLRRAWRIWRAKSMLLAPVRQFGPESYPRQLLYRELYGSAQAAGPVFPPYHALSEFWHAHAAPGQPNYTTFLQVIAKCRCMELSSILDLACGAGTLTERLARVVPEVVGLDISERMLAQAHARCSGLLGVQLVKGDFRDFKLDRQFDAAVCAHDSLNYVASANELADVFRSVAQHLRVGGLFVFDTITRRGMQDLNGRYLHFEVNGQRFAIHFEYDSCQHTEKSTVMLPAGIEEHCRTPIDPEDVMSASRHTDLEVEDYFSHAILPGKWSVGQRCFFLLLRAR